MGVQKRRANDIDIINCQEKKEVWVACLRKGRGKEFGRRRARVRGRNKQGFLSFSSRDRKSLSLSKDCHAGQRKDSKRLGLLSARLTAKKLCEHVELEYIGEVDVPGRWRRHSKVTQIQKLLFHSLFFCIFAVTYFFNIPFCSRNTAPSYTLYIIELWDEVNSGEIRRNVRRFGQWGTRLSGYNYLFPL